MVADLRLIHSLFDCTEFAEVINVEPIKVLKFRHHGSL